MAEKRRNERNTEKLNVKKKKKRENTYFDYNLLFLVIFLICFGMVMLYSSSSYICATSKKYNYDGAYYLKKQMFNAAIGAGGMIFFTWMDYHKWKKWGPIDWRIWSYLGSFALCMAVIFIGKSSHGSTRWLAIGPVQFQPSEIAKVGVIVFLAAILENMGRQLKKPINLFKVFLMVLPIIGVVAVSNLSTAIIIAGIAVCMMFVASPKYSHFFALGGMGVALGGLGILLFPYRLGRVTTWLFPEQADPDDIYQTMQGLYAIGSGGFFGKGLGESLQKMGNVPESQNDMIFTIICEELGLFGGISLILLFMLILWRMMVIANNAPDLFGSLLVIGVMSHIAIQVFLNIAVVTAFIPNTGVILPFISYGGTSYIILMCEVGLVLGVSRQIKLESIK